MTGDLVDLFKCFICYDEVKKPVLCPQCSKVGCSKCYSTWVEQTGSCPHCRSMTSPNDLVRVRFVEDLLQNIQNPKVCDRHEMTLVYYCHDCQDPICPDCIISDVDHKDHAIEKLKKVYLDAKSKMTKELERMEQLMRDFDKKMIEIGISEADLNAVHACEKQKLHEYIRELQNELTKKYKDLMEPLIESRSILQNKKGSLSHAIQHSKTKMQSASMIDLIDHSKRMNSVVEKLSAESLPSVKEPKLSWIPDFETVEFDVDNFSDYVQSKSLICSNPVVLSGNSWRLRIYCQADNSISVYLQQVKGQSKSQSFEYKIEVLGHLSFSRSNTCSFSYPQSWGYSQFCRLQDLEKGGFLVNDTLHMRFHVRHLNWKQRALDLQKYCDSLKMNPDLAKDDEEVGFDENDCAMNHDESMDADHGSASESRVVCADRDEIDQLMMEIFEDSENELKEPELYDQSSSDNEQVQYYESSSESETEQVIFV